MVQVLLPTSDVEDVSESSLDRKHMQKNGLSLRCPACFLSGKLPLASPSKDDPKLHREQVDHLYPKSRGGSIKSDLL